MLLKSHGHGDVVEVVRPTVVVPCRRRSSTVAVLPLRTQICRVLPLRAWICCRSPSSCMNMSLFSFFAQQTTTLFPAAATLRGLIKCHRRTACDLSLSLHDSTLPLSPMIVDLFLFPIFVYYILCLFLFLFLFFIIVFDYFCKQFWIFLSWDSIKLIRSNLFLIELVQFGFSERKNKIWSNPTSSSFDRFG